MLFELSRRTAEVFDEAVETDLDVRWCVKRVAGPVFYRFSKRISVVLGLFLFSESTSTIKSHGLR